MVAEQRPGCLARAGQWFFYMLAGLLIGAIVAGLLHAWNPSFGILPAAYSLNARPIVPITADLPVMQPTLIAQTAPTPNPITATVVSTVPANAVETSSAAAVTTTAPVTNSTAITTAVPVSATPTIQPEEAQFLADAQLLFITYVDLLESLSRRLMEALEDPAVAEDPTWREETSAQVTEMRSVGSEVRALIAPMRYAAAWDEMRIATVFFDRALDALTTAVETRAPDQIQTARANLQIAVDAVNRAAAALAAAMPATTPTPAPLPARP